MISDVQNARSYYATITPGIYLVVVSARMVSNAKHLLLSSKDPAKMILKLVIAPTDTTICQIEIDCKNFSRAEYMAEGIIKLLARAEGPELGPPEKGHSVVFGDCCLNFTQKETMSGEHLWSPVTENGRVLSRIRPKKRTQRKFAAQ